MQGVRCGVLVAARHAKWAQWSLAQWPDPRLGARAWPSLPSSDPAAMHQALRASEPALQLILLFVTPDSVAWAGRMLRALTSAGAAGLPALVITRGLGVLALEQLLRDGASDFLPSPCEEPELIARMERWLAPSGSGTAAPPSPSPSLPAPSHPAFAQLIGQSPVFRRQVERIPAIAACQAAVLISGETGTGKELFAQAVHYLSPRANGPWIAVNCGALPADLVEAELFGHARGAYTSAHQAREGLVAQAEGGTLFLDEIDSLPLASQTKLLRFLQDKAFRPVGASELRHAQVRIVSASNVDLLAQVEAGQFRRDLYFRLNVLALRLPALRERVADIAELARFFVQRHARELERAVPVLSPPACAALLAHPWPGNVRELEHCLERAVLLCRDGVIRPEDLDLPSAVVAGHGPTFESDAASFQAAKARAIEAFERQYLQQVLQRCHGNIAQAAAAASKNRRAFFELMRKHHIDAEAYRR